MKHTKLVLAGLTAALALTGATGVLAEEVSTEKVQQTAENGQEPENMRDTTDRVREGFRKVFGFGDKENMPEIDMSGLELPEDFVPFDEAHVPDGQNAPERGELKPIEFDADGNMTYGQRPEGMMPMMDGERPELPEGEMPQFDGERPELPEGEIPQFDGERPELPEGEIPQFDGERPELPEGEMPQFDGERPELPEGEMPQFDGELPELPEGGMPQFGGQQGAPMMNGQSFGQGFQGMQSGRQGA